MSLGAPVGVAAQPPDELGVARPEADPESTLVAALPDPDPPPIAASPEERPLPLPVVLPVLLDDVPVPLDDVLAVDVQHSSSAGPGQNPGVET